MLVLTVKRVSIDNNIDLLAGMTYIATAIKVPNKTIYTLTFPKKDKTLEVKGVVSEEIMHQLISEQRVVVLPKSYLRKLAEDIQDLEIK